jgi:hypothetical protein
LDERINARYATPIDWRSLCDMGVALVLFDGLDELPLHHRSRGQDEVRASSARFPNAPWIMTVRDMAGTAAPVDARVVALQPHRAANGSSSTSVHSTGNRSNSGISRAPSVVGSTARAGARRSAIARRRAMKGSRK